MSLPWPFISRLCVTRVSSCGNAGRTKRKRRSTERTTMEAIVIPVAGLWLMINAANIRRDIGAWWFANKYLEPTTPAMKPPTAANVKPATSMKVVQIALSQIMPVKK